MLKSRFVAFSCALLVAFAVLPAFAEADPPGRVARVSYLQGDISFQPAGAEDWAVLGMNRPLTTSDRVWTAEKARTEMHVGNAALRLGPNSGFAFLNLNDNTTQVQLTQGVLSVRLRELGPREAFEVDTPNVALTLLRSGLYRIDVDPEGYVTSITVRSGYAGAGGGGRSFTIHAGEQAYFTGTGSPDFSLRHEPKYDAFDEWCTGRDLREDRAVSARYVSRGVIGYEDLDEYGDWRSVPTYGNVWVPRMVSVGWAPYRYGHWAWVGPWGWTWIDDSPWGFAPYHYGRWMWMPAGYWGWIPGPMVVRPVYAPALVAWVGGMHFTAFSAPVYGWFPLGYREAYIPWYGASRAYWHRVNVTNTYITNTYITNIYERHQRHDVERITYVNQHVNGAVTAVPQRTFLEGGRVDRDRVHVPGKDWKSAEVIHTPPANPTHQSLLGATAGTSAPRPPASAIDRHIVTRIKPPEAAAPFSKIRTRVGDAEPRPVVVEHAPTGAVTKPLRTENTEAREHGSRPANSPPGMGRSTREAFGRPAEREASTPQREVIKSGSLAAPRQPSEMREREPMAPRGDSRMRQPGVDLSERRAEAPPRAAPQPAPAMRHDAPRPEQHVRPPEMARPAAPAREVPHAQPPRTVPQRSAESRPEPRPQSVPRAQTAPRQRFR